MDAREADRERAGIEVRHAVQAEGGWARDDAVWERARFRMCHARGGAMGTGRQIDGHWTETRVWESDSAWQQAVATDVFFRLALQVTVQQAWS